MLMEELVTVRKRLMNSVPNMSSVNFWLVMVLIVGPILVLVYTAILRVFLYVLVYTFDSIPLVYVQVAMYVILAIGIIGSIVTIREMWKSMKENPSKSTQ